MFYLYNFPHEIDYLPLLCYLPSYSMPYTFLLSGKSKSNFQINISPKVEAGLFNLTCWKLCDLIPSTFYVSYILQLSYRNISRYQAEKIKTRHTLWTFHVPHSHTSIWALYLDFATLTASLGEKLWWVECNFSIITVLFNILQISSKLYLSSLLCFQFFKFLCLCSHGPLYVATSYFILLTFSHAL